ncbi:bifunctional diguanylate cyclase/phosphodiesterase [Hippea jasoniae]|uniref:bifunctional diguanylate cyclase/phosphodiesterase n=1 Tax=Hippea jasoniae TaxID=944479 RepID=UPI00055115D9|nr:GGDEF domain-containing phosphodiesterase [Hippea jasoniae]
MEADRRMEILLSSNVFQHIFYLSYETKSRKIIDISQSLEKLLDFSKAELKQKTADEIFSKEGLDNIEKQLDEDGSITLEIKTKSKAIKILKATVESSFVNNTPVNLLILSDITKEEIFKTFYQLLSKINNSIITSTTKDGLFEDISKKLISQKYIELVVVLSIKPNMVKVENYAGRGKYVENLIKNASDVIKTINYGPLFEAFRTSDIHINPDTDSNPEVSDWKIDMLSFGFRSSCYIPLSDSGGKYMLCIYSSIPFFFDSYIIDVLKEMQNDLNFALSNIEKLFFKDIFYTAIQQKDWVLITDFDGNITYVNESVEQLSGYTKKELIGSKPSIFKSGLYDNEFYKSMWDTITLGKAFKGVIVNRHKNGELYQLYHTIVPIQKAGRISHFVAISKDISREMYLEEEIRKFKYYDQLTGLLNEKGFELEAEKLTQKSLSKDKQKGIITIDIFDFSKLNNIYGVYTCDRLLKEIASKLTKKGLVVGRVGDDEFAMFNFYSSLKEIENDIANIIEFFSKSIDVDSYKIKTHINIGAAVDTENRLDIRTLLSHATTAMAAAKQQGANNFKVYNPQLNEIIHKDHETLNLISESLTKKYFTFFLQPIYNNNEEIAEFESLARIDHPQKGLLSPYFFIDQLETSHYLVQFEEFLINTIPQYLDSVHKKAGKFIPISINLSMRNLKEGRIFDILKQLSDEYRKHLILEVTERMFADDIDSAMNMLKNLKDRGFKVMIDDFGTGYSSLSYLHLLPIDAIKIDISFIRRITENEKVKSIVQTTINLAKKLNFGSVAEGVETNEQLRILKGFGCDLYQGYYFAKPMPLDEILKIV